jgi:DNA polymerase III subunit delta'
MQFQQVIGQIELKKQLIGKVKSGKIPHALLFLGQEGVGTLSLAIAFAQYVNCLEPTELDSCGQCSSCRKMEKYIHPDLHFSFPFVKSTEIKISDPMLPQWRDFLDKNPYGSYRNWMDAISAEGKQGNIPNEECKNFLSKLTLMSFEAKYKVLIIWMPEFLGQSGNILLKMIEEPPANTLFLLVGRESDSILPTILSRVQTVKVGGIETNHLSHYLQEFLGVPANQSLSLANVSEGNLSEAIRLLENQASNNEELFKRWMRLCYSLPSGADDLVQWVLSVSVLGREAQKGLLNYGLFLIREAFLFKFGACKKERLTESEHEFISKFSNLVNDKNVPFFSQILSDGERYIERNGNPKIIFHALSLDLNAAFRKA